RAVRSGRDRSGGRGGDDQVGPCRSSSGRMGGAARRGRAPPITRTGGGAARGPRARPAGRGRGGRRRPCPSAAPPRRRGGGGRASGEWIEGELGRGVHAEGAAITSAGVIPTPATAYVTRAMGFDAGLVISASHNPFEDNGIKVFSGRGEKFTEALERQVEAIV